MTLRVSAKVVGVQSTVRALERAKPKGSAWVSKALLRSAFLVQSLAATKYIVRGRGRGAAPLPDRLTWRTGRLASSIATDRSGIPRSISVATDVVYGAVHEGGRRPFLQPALEEASQSFEKIFRRAWSEAL